MVVVSIRFNCCLLNNTIPKTLGEQSKKGDIQYQILF